MDTIAEKHGITTVCRLPVNPEPAAAVDAGSVELCDNGYLCELITTPEKLEENGYEGCGNL